MISAHTYRDQETSRGCRGGGPLCTAVPRPKNTGGTGRDGIYNPGSLGLSDPRGKFISRRRAIPSVSFRDVAEVRREKGHAFRTKQGVFAVNCAARFAALQMSLQFNSFADGEPMRLRQSGQLLKFFVVVRTFAFTHCDYPEAS